MSVKYRPDIDGLRAIAVLSVILYHAEINFFGVTYFSGGFIGVDIFFLISGYLITSIIIDELEKKKEFSFKYFFQRRIRRILPVLIFVIIFSIPVAWLILLPHNFLDYSKSILFSLGFSSNYFFHFSTIEYGATSSKLIPFLHTWSLSVEEQFYIIYPFFFYFIYKINQKFILSFLLFLLFSSFFFSYWISTTNQSLNFYFLPSRIWELLIGCSISFFEKKKKIDFSKIRIGNLLSFIGLISIICSFFYLNDKVYSTSPSFLIPILGTAMLLMFYDKKFIVTRILSSKVFVGIGLISYSLYLWHYPVFSFSRWTEFTQGQFSRKIFLGAVIFILSLLSYFFIEKPARSRKVSFKNIFALIILSSFFIVLFNILAIFKDGYQSRVPSDLRKSKFDETFKNYDEFIYCLKKIRENKDFCKFGDFNKDAYLVGDSHMIQISFDLKSKLKENGYNLVTMTFPGAVYGAKQDIDKIRDNYLKKIENSIVIFGGYIHSEKSKFFELNRKKYNDILDTLEKNKNKIFIIYPIPSVRLNYNFGMINEYKETNELKDSFIKKNEFFKDSLNAYEFYNSFEQANIHRIFPSKISCDDKNCYSIKDNKILISDYDHPSTIFSEEINSLIVDMIDN